MGVVLGGGRGAAVVLWKLTGGVVGVTTTGTGVFLVTKTVLVEGTALADVSTISGAIPPLAEVAARVWDKLEGWSRGGSGGG